MASAHVQDLFHVTVTKNFFFLGGGGGGEVFPSYISGVHHFLGEIFAYVTVF